MSNYFLKHEEFWSKAYDVNDEKSFNLHLRKKYIIDEIEKLSIEKGSKILDIGCGTGEISFELESEGYSNITAQDISPDFIKIAKDRQKKEQVESQISFSIGGVSNLEFNDNTFQLVIASGLIEWVRYDRWALQEMERVIKPGGYLIVTGPNKIRLSNLLTPRRLWNLWKARKLPRVQEPFSRHWYSYRGLAELLVIAGYEVKKIRTNGFAQLPPVRWNSMLSLKIFKVLQYIADRNPGGWIGRMGSNIISVAQKSLTTEQHKRIDKNNLSTYCSEYEYRFQREFIKLNDWEKNNQGFIFDKGKGCFTSIELLNKIMVIAPHPDDELIGCGGFLIRKKNEGAQVGIIYLTDGRSTKGRVNGSEEILNITRYEEARNVVNSLDIDKVSYLDGISGELKTNKSLEESVTEFIDNFKPDAILIPFINDPHRDHLESNKILARALMKSKVNPNEITILSYEVWALVPANVYYNIDEFSDQKSSALMQYKTAMQVVDYKRDCFDRSIYHGINKNGFVSQLEAFFCTNGETYLRLLPNK